MMGNSHVRRRVALLASIGLGFALAGCQVVPDRGLAVPAGEVIRHGFSSAPRPRLGAYPCAIVGTPFIGGELGSHGYHFRPAEKNGIVYTRRAGHIDTMHLRIAADWTAYLAAESYRHLLRGDRSFSYKLLVDRSRSFVHLSYPANWHDLPPERRSAIAREAALALGPYLAYTLVTWHEILTWYGFKCIGLPSEFASAFSWEDSYSNLLGTVVAARALADTEHPYDEALTLALAEELRRLGVQPAAVAKQAGQLVRGDWYTGSVTMTVDMRKRNFDIGLDGFVTPMLVPDVPGCEGAEPASYPAPALAALSRHGLAATVEIEPHEWEKGKILCLVYPDGRGRRIRPDLHFAPLMADIRRDAAARYGPDATTDALPARKP